MAHDDSGAGRSVRSAIRKIARVLVACIVVLCVTGLLVEAGATAWLYWAADADQFRLFATLDQYVDRAAEGDRARLMFQPHRYIGYIPTPDYDAVNVRHNQWGMRGPEITLEKPPGQFRIACLGGSTTYSCFPGTMEEYHKNLEILNATHGDENDPRVVRFLHERGFDTLDEWKRYRSFPGFLELNLHERGFDHVRVMNFGAMGYTSWESLAALQFRALEFDPDMVLVYHGYNDIHQRLVWPPKYYRADRSGSGGHSPGFYQDLPLYLQSNLIRIVMVASGKQPSLVSLQSTFDTFEPHAQFWAYHQQILAGTYPDGLFRKVPAQEILETNRPVYFRSNLQSIGAIAASHRISPVFLSFAFYEDSNSAFNTDDYRHAIAEHNDVIEDVARQPDHYFVDIDTLYPREATYFSDVIHFSDAGGRVMARLVADQLLAKGLIPGTNDDERSE